ncbi:DUF4232 domain-containing protein [Amycolatopsis nigrescens]|uniref:DUF4232 domain-containing protein n=1 Tax=Amycolatopsis nigrescens TaxID=381445 RepID=UPI00036FCA0B|nr:DUF4232 domain-containing protein [Amycolatopsis nigrescens]
MARGRISQVGLAVTGAALAAALTGCGDGGGNAAQPPASTATDTPSASSSSSAPSSTPSSSGTPTSEAPPPAPPQDNGLCKAKDLEVSLGGGDAAAGTVYRSLIFKNVSGQKCEIQGFPGVSYVGGEDGHQVGPAAFREGQKGEPISLGKGETASADVGFVNVHNYDPTVCQPQLVRGLRIYPPQETESKYVEMSGNGCGSDKIPGNQLTVKTIQKGSD